MYFRTVMLYFMIIQFWNLDCNKRKCKRYGEDVCCRNFRYNEALDTCEDCPIGYHYWNCSRKCQHPFYGKDCQKECNCNMDDCHFSYGCPSIKSSTQVTTHTEYEITLRTITRMIASTITQLPNKQTIAAKTPNDFPLNKTNFIIIIVSVGLGLFLLLFGMLVGVCIHKSLQRNVGRIPNNDFAGKEDHSYTPIRQQAESHQTASQAGNICENSAYLTPLSEGMGLYEEVVLYDFPEESLDRTECQIEPYYSDTANNVTDTYLTPTSVSQHVYVEVIQ